MHRALAEAIVLFERGVQECHRPEDRAQAERYLAALAPVLAGAVTGDDVLPRLEAIERLFGHSWLVDSAPFEAAFHKWRSFRSFRSEYEQRVLGAMSINERPHIGMRH